MRYRADPAGDRRAIDADGVTLLYHRPSGITHVIAAPVPEILAALSDDPADIAALARRLPADWELGAEDLPVLQVRLDELIDAGLIAPA